METLTVVGVDMDDVGAAIEARGVTAFYDSFAHLRQSLREKSSQLVGR